MVQIGVQVVNPDGVDAEDLEQGGITEANIRVAQRVNPI